MNNQEQEKSVEKENKATAPSWWKLFALIFFPLHFVITASTMGLRFEHILLDGAMVAAMLIGPRARVFAYHALPFALTGIAYDNLRFLIAFRSSTIHVSDVYLFEKAWFGVGSGAARQIYPEYFKDHPVVFFDVVCGFAYILYLVESILFATYLYLRNRARMTRFAWAFLLINLMGIVTYLAFPLAPPWYVEEYGLGSANLAAKPSAAGAARFDEIMGVRFFENFYARNPNVFGAMPSLHAGYPALVFFATLSMGWKWFLPTGAFALLVAFSAIYLRHHYVIDVIAGAVYGALAWALVPVLGRVCRRIGERLRRKTGVCL